MKYYLLLLTILLELTASAQLPNVRKLNIAKGNKMGSFPSAFHNYQNQRLYFFADDRIHGSELWSLIPSGVDTPVMVADLHPNGNGTIHNNFFRKITSIGEDIYFQASDGQSGYELWTMNVNGGLSLVADLDTSTNRYAGSYPMFLTAHKGKLYFRAAENRYKEELYVYTPGMGNVRRLTNFDSVAPTPLCYHITPLGSKVYFSGANDKSGNELFCYDTASDSVYIASDVNTMAWESSNPNNLVTYNNKLYFIAYNGTAQQIYELDSNNKLSQLTSFVYNLFHNGIEARPFQLIAYKNALYFSAGVGSETKQLYKYDMASKLTTRFAVINTQWHASPTYFTIYKDKLYFAASDSANGQELWVYDGLSAPKLAVDIAPGRLSSGVSYLTVCGDYLYFAADDKSGDSIELFEYSEPTVSVNEKNIPYIPAVVYPNPAKDIAHLEIDLKQNQTLQATVTDMSGRTVYRSDKVLYSAAKHTIDIPLQNLPPGNYVYSLREINGALVASGKLVKEVK